MYKQSTYSWLRDWDFIFWDLICMQITFWASYSICISPGAHNDWLYRNESFILIFCQIVSIFFISPFRGILKRGYYIEFIESFKHVCVVMLLAVLHMFLTGQISDYSRTLFAMTTFFYFILTYLSRTFLKLRLRKKGRSSIGIRSLIVLTESGMADKVLSGLEDNPNNDFFISGIILLDQDLTGQRIRDIPVVCSVRDMRNYVRHEWVDEIFIKISDQSEYPSDLIDSFILMGITVHVTLAKIEGMRGGTQHIEFLGGETVLSTSISVISPRQRLYKRIMDVIGGIVGCFITAVLFLFLAPAIYLRSPGPIFFSQVRIGQNGRQFKLYKFRSMHTDAELQKNALLKQNKMQGQPLMFKMDYDPRVIGNGKNDRHGNPKGIGHFIRRTSLDEFPQFWNVLKGEMSIVGTRPPTTDEWDLYEQHHRIRMAAKPGITGLWQVSGRSKITDFDEVVKLDTEYIKNWSLGLDCKIILKTIYIMFTRDGAM